MPARAKKVGDRWRVVEARTEKLVKNSRGTPVDGGGFVNRKRAVAQAQAINMSQR